MSVRRAQALTLSFPAIDSNARPARKTGVVFSAGQCRIKRDGGAAANTTNLPSEDGATGRYNLTLTAPEMDAAFVHVFVEAPGIDPYDFQIGTHGAASGTVQADGSNTATTFKTDRGETAVDHWKDSLLLFTTGALAGQVKKVSAFDPTTDFITVSAAFTAAPTAGDRFVFVNL